MTERKMIIIQTISPGTKTKRYLNKVYLNFSNINLENAKYTRVLDTIDQDTVVCLAFIRFSLQIVIISHRVV